MLKLRTVEAPYNEVPEVTPKDRARNKLANIATVLQYVADNPGLGARPEPEELENLVDKLVDVMYRNSASGLYPRGLNWKALGT